MFCNNPTVAFRLAGKDPLTGKHHKPWSFHQFRSDDDVERLFNSAPPGNEAIILPCGKCLLCTKRYRLHWVLRCMHEARFYSQMCYITLTVDDAHIDGVFPPVCSFNGSSWHSLRHKPFQDFMKRLRRQLDYGYRYAEMVDGKPVDRIYKGEPGRPLRFYMCGEYGEKFHRPHYHAIIFGFFPPDARPLRGNLCTSDLVSRKWPFGFHTIAKVEPACVSYVAGYVDKKLDDARMDWAFNGVAPEYVAMSRGSAVRGTGGIGREFFDNFYKEIYPMNDDGSFARNFAIIGSGTRVKVPRYYDDLLDLRDPERYDKLLAFREQVGSVLDADFDLVEWLNESHRRHAVAAARKRPRLDPGVTSQAEFGLVDAQNHC